MPGKLCFGSTYNNAGAGRLQDSKAFCEGALYRASDTVLNVPITDNPHAPGSEAADAWDAGWTIADGASGTTLGAVGCCAYIGDVPA